MEGEYGKPLISCDVLLHYLLNKPNDSISCKPADTLAERISRLVSTFAEKLEPIEDLVSIFSIQPPRWDLHIIVKVSVTGKSEPISAAERC